MIIELKGFGDVLTSRQSGREAWISLQQVLRGVDPEEKIEISFDGFLTFSPGWADEFITRLRKEFGSRLVLRHTDNPSVKATLDILNIFLNDR